MFVKMLFLQNWYAESPVCRLYHAAINALSCLLAYFFLQAGMDQVSPSKSKLKHWKPVDSAKVGKLLVTGGYDKGTVLSGRNCSDIRMCARVCKRMLVCVYAHV